MAVRPADEAAARKHVAAITPAAKGIHPSAPSTQRCYSSAEQQFSWTRVGAGAKTPLLSGTTALPLPCPSCVGGRHGCHGTFRGCLCLDNE